MARQIEAVGTVQRDANLGEQLASLRVEPALPGRGVVDGTVDELRAIAAEMGYEEQLERIAPFVESVGADGLYEITDEFTR